MRHLYHHVFEEMIDLPVYMILIKIIWSKKQGENYNFQKIISGVVDLSDFIKNGHSGKNIELQLE